MSSWSVIWDMDGVLVETEEFHYLSWAAALARDNIPFSREQFKLTFGMNNTGTLKHLLGPDITTERVQAIGDYKDECFSKDILGKVRLLPGVQRWLEWFKEHCVKQAIASSAPQIHIEAIADELNIHPFFEVLYSAARLPGKPDPTVFLLAAQALKTSPERCLVIEDSIAGVAAAKRAGMKCLAVATTNPPEVLSEADLVVERLTKLAPEELDAWFQPGN